MSKLHIIEATRRYVIAQKELWRRVPWRALFADDGVGGCRENDFSLAYYSGLWRIRESAVHTMRLVAIDLFTGELVYANGPRELALDESVYRLSSKIELLDAEVVLRQLSWRATRPEGLPAPEGYPSLAVWRAEIIARTGLSELYEPIKFKK